MSREVSENMKQAVLSSLILQSVGNKKRASNKFEIKQHRPLGRTGGALAFSSGLVRWFNSFTDRSGMCGWQKVIDDFLIVAHCNNYRFASVCLLLIQWFSYTSLSQTVSIIQWLNTAHSQLFSLHSNISHHGSSRPYDAYVHPEQRLCLCNSS